MPAPPSPNWTFDLDLRFLLRQKQRVFSALAQSLYHTPYLKPIWAKKINAANKPQGLSPNTTDA
jgi:hypothetical protein